MTLRYQDAICVVASMHKKEQAIQPSFETLLGCKCIQTDLNTDSLGTFTGEIERKLSPYECAKEKCKMALTLENADICVANEGSFGPHPFIPFIAADHELLFFIDKNLGFNLSIYKIFLKTNYKSKTIQKIEELHAFAKEALFPSHGLIVRPNISENRKIYKGIQNLEDLLKAFSECSKDSSDEKVWVGTDMRAHMNPTRMQMIAELALEMSTRLATPCPACQIPGWGIVRKETGLACEICRSPTELLKSEVYGCCKCPYSEILPVNEGVEADPRYCPFCNP